jgi:hypothetical protein
LLVGDSVAHGTFAYIKENNLSSKCAALANIEGVAAANEQPCFWSQSTASATGQPVKWDVIHFNEGLHSLWPRVNTTAELAEWAEQLGAWTEVLKGAARKVVYGTMTPFMPEKSVNCFVVSAACSTAAFAFKTVRVYHLQAPIAFCKMEASTACAKSYSNVVSALK